MIVPSPEERSLVEEVIADISSTIGGIVAVCVLLAGFAAAIAVSVGVPLVVLYALVRFVKWAWD